MNPGAPIEEFKCICEFIVEEAANPCAPNGRSMRYAGEGGRLLL